MTEVATEAAMMTLTLGALMLMTGAVDLLHLSAREMMVVIGTMEETVTTEIDTMGEGAMTETTGEEEASPTMSRPGTEMVAG